MPLRLAVLPLALLVAAPSAAQTTPAATAPTPARSALMAKARANGATDVVARPAPAGGVTLVGKLEGDQFAASFPAEWKGDGLVYAEGYSTPDTQVTVSEDPTEASTGRGMMRFAYDDGVAVGHSAYDKDGLGVETDTRNTKRLRDFLVRMCAPRVLPPNRNAPVARRP